MGIFFYYFEPYLGSKQIVVGNNSVEKFNKIWRSELHCNIFKDYFRIVQYYFQQLIVRFYAMI